MAQRISEDFSNTVFTRAHEQSSICVVQTWLLSSSSLEYSLSQTKRKSIHFRLMLTVHKFVILIHPTKHVQSFTRHRAER